VAAKRPESTVENLTKRVEKLENSPSHTPTTIFSRFRSLDLVGKSTVVGVAIAILALLVTYFSWVQPQWKAEADDVTNHKIDDRIEAKLQAHHLDDLASKVNKMEGQLNEISGYLKLLTARDLAQAASLSKDEFRKRLPQVQNTLQAATAAETRVPEATTHNIQTRLLSVSETEPVFWGTASALIDYRSALRVSFLPSDAVNCYSIFQKYEPHPPTVNSRRMAIEVGHCTLFIDDVEAFDQSEFGKHFHAEVAEGVTDIMVLVLNNVHIVYRGGKTIPYSAIHCDNCTYSFQAPIAPPSQGKALIRGALLAYNGNLDLHVGL